MPPLSVPRRHPHLYEISAWPWVERLSLREGRPITLAHVPQSDWDRIGDAGFDYVYLMGVWKRSAFGRLLARTDPDLLAAYDRALPGWSMRDVPGSPYAIQAYEPDDRMGGWPGLDAARTELAKRGVRLMLDFVANHTGLDHEWIATRPDLYVQGTVDDFRRSPERFHPVDAGDTVTMIACGRDPYFPPWRDVAQLNYWNPATRDAMFDVLRTISQHCDAVRCDMAMLVLNDVFARTWDGVDLLWPRPDREFWPDAVQRASPLVFLGEVYWDLEFELQQQGFHYTYDKRLLDWLRAGDADAIRAHLRVDQSFSARLARFVENHDEPRAAAVFGTRVQAAASTALTLPGLRCFYDGQLEGRTVQAPVQLGRWPHEESDPAVTDFYRRLLAFINDPLLHDGDWQRLDVRGTGSNGASLLAACWRREEARALIVVNISAADAEGFVALDGFPDRDAHAFEDRVTGARYRRTRADLAGGLHVWLAAGRAHLFRVEAET